MTQSLIDVDRASIQRLLAIARKHCKEAATECRDSQPSFVVMYWDGYIRALETVLDMEYE